MLIYLNVSFSEKDEAKALGAKWDSTKRRWYFKGSIKNVTTLSKWIDDTSPFLDPNRIYFDIPIEDNDEVKELDAKWDSELKSWYYDGPPEYYPLFSNWFDSKYKSRSHITANFKNDFESISKPSPIPSRLYFDVPFDEKEEAKELGARWNSTLKKWFIDVSFIDAEVYAPFTQWILGEKTDVIVITENLYILEGIRTCWKCGHPTKVIALGVTNYVEFERDDDVLYFDNHYIDYVGEEEPIRLAWVDNEYQIPPLILNYIKQKYNVKMGYSKTVGKCFANHCDHCGCIQGNNFIFEEEDSPFFPYADSPEALSRKMKNITIYTIGIIDDLILDWTVYDHSNSQNLWDSTFVEDYTSLDGYDCLFGYKQMYFL